MKKLNLEDCIWSVLTFITLIEILRAVKKYAYYGRGLEYGLTIVLPLMALLPMMIAWQSSQIKYLIRSKSNKKTLWFLHVLLLCFYVTSFVLLILKCLIR